MKMKSILFTTLCALFVFTSFDASARIWRYHRSRTVYRQPRPAPPPKPPVPKTLQVSGTLYSLNGPGRSLMIQDDNTKSMLNLVITPQTKFIRDGKTIPPAGLKTYEHVAVSYQDTDSTVKEVRVTSASGTPAPKSGKTGKPKTKK
jgi:hypothetical protein